MTGRTDPGQAAADSVTPEWAIASSGLTKRFRGGQLAVDDVNLAVPAGSVYGFLGPNGSGKTTTIRMLLGLAFPTSGTTELLGVKMSAGWSAGAGRSGEHGRPAGAGRPGGHGRSAGAGWPGGHSATQVLSRVGSLVEGPAFYPYLSGWENLARYDAADRFASPKTAKARIGEALERVGLTAAAKKRYRNYSLGMKQRLAIAAGLMQPRELIILDEPTNGLDPQGTREVRSLIRQIAADGITVFVSSHLLAEVEQVSSHVGVMRAGKLVFQGSLPELRRTGAARISVRTGDVEAAAKVLRKLGLSGTETADGMISAALGDMAALGEDAPEKICAELVHAGIGVRGLAVETPSLEDLFVGLTGEGFDVER